jgi:osmotically-inducible protein OsmY
MTMEKPRKDSLLQQDVMDELDFEPSVNAAHIGVTAKNGVITLTGHVGSYAEKIAAEDAARRVHGVHAIAQEIEVRYASDKKTSDDEIAARALSVLKWNAVVPYDAVQVKVQDGWVTLLGQVDWQFQRVAAESGIRRLSGVAGVLNEIKLKPSVSPVDVKRKIEDALKRSAEIEAASIHVSALGNGKVALEGKVHDWQERNAVKRAAWSTAGVTSIDDRLQIV